MRIYLLFCSFDAVLRHENADGLAKEQTKFFKKRIKHYINQLLLFIKIHV